jgi:pimeloyl-ACP methyl ester carboxylesterase
MIEASREHLGWVLHESGPASADHTVLLLPGALCTAAFYDDLLAEPSMKRAPIRFVATTVPGFGGTAAPEDLSMESYSKLAGQLASDLGCDAVVGHSLGANIAVEMASAGEFSGPLVLLSPSFSRTDESRFPRALDRLSRVLGHLPYSLMLKIIGPAMKRLAADTPRSTDRRVEEERPSVRPRADPPVSRVPRPPRLARPAFCRFGRAGVGRVRRER